MFLFISGVVVGAAFSPFWLSLWNKFSKSPAVQAGEVAVEDAVKKVDAPVNDQTSAPKS